MAGENLVRPKGFKATLENFWYHYKYHTIVILLVIFTLAVSITQCSTKSQYDYQIVIATQGIQLSSKQLELMENELALYGEDLNKDGNVNVLLVDCTIGTDMASTQTYMANQQRLQSIIMSDTSTMMFITDSKRYDWIMELGKNSSFIENTGLPNGDGRYYNLSKTHIIENPKKELETIGKFVWPELRICRRTIKGTLFEGRDGVDELAKQADEFIARLVKGTSK